MGIYGRDTVSYTHLDVYKRQCETRERGRKMAEYDIMEAGGRLTISGTYVNTLDVEGFAQMMKDPSYCYKLSLIHI